MSADDRTREHVVLQESYDKLRKEFSKALETIDRLSKQIDHHPGPAYIRAVGLAEPIFTALHEALLDCCDDYGYWYNSDDFRPWMPQSIVDAFKAGKVAEAADAFRAAYGKEDTVKATDTDALRDKYTGTDVDRADFDWMDVVKLCDEVDRLRAQIERAQRKVRPA